MIGIIFKGALPSVSGDRSGAQWYVFFFMVWVVFRCAFQVLQVTVQVSNGMFLNDFNGFQVCLSGVPGDRSGVQWYAFK